MKVSLPLGSILTKMKIVRSNFNFQDFKNPKRNCFRSTEKIIQEKFDSATICRRRGILENHIFEKNTSAPNDLEITLTGTRPKVPHIC